MYLILCFSPDFSEGMKSAKWWKEIGLSTGRIHDHPQVHVVRLPGLWTEGKSA